jgi:predicted nucleic-acid-binding protein
VIALDTHVLARVFVDDPGEETQTRIARDLVRQAGRVYVPQVVQVETVWVLESAYGLPKSETVRVLEHLLDNQAYRLQESDAFRDALEAYWAGSADFADYLVLAAARVVEAELVTFDRRLARSSGAVLAAAPPAPGG